MGHAPMAIANSWQRPGAQQRFEQLRGEERFKLLRGPLVKVWNEAQRESGYELSHTGPDECVSRVTDSHIATASTHDVSPGARRPLRATQLNSFNEQLFHERDAKQQRLHFARLVQRCVTHLPRRFSYRGELRFHFALVLRTTNLLSIVSFHSLRDL